MQIFPNLGETYYQLTILLTTSNFPDVMLPAVQMNTLYFLFFWAFLTLGLYLLLNILLATIFSGYKTRITERALETTKNRLVYIEKYFNMNAGDKEFLDPDESKNFFTQVLGLNYR